MRTKNSLYWCAAVLALGFATAGFAQPTLQEPALSGQERQELRELLRRFDPERPNPEDLPLFQQRWLLNQLRDLTTLSLLPPENETLTVCDTVGKPHLNKGDVVRLSRVGASGNVRMEVLRNVGTPTESHPWTNPGGGNIIIINPSITGKPHPTNPAFKKFTPEGVGIALVHEHPDGNSTDHDIFLRRNTRTPDALCSNPDPLMLSIPEQHPTGERHAGHAVLD